MRIYDNPHIIEKTQEAMDGFGHGYGSSTEKINKHHIDALMQGKMLAIDDGEYVTFLVFDGDVVRK